jgi:hypothetical protein
MAEGTRAGSGSNGMHTLVVFGDSYSDTGKLFQKTQTLAPPQVYFHVTTAYALLRQGGVDLGKKDFLGELPVVDL